jgi:ABC-type uncharacterized transport system ATPase component
MISNYGILDPTPSDPAGYVTKDGMWAAVPYGNKFIIIHNGQQIHTSNNYNTAKSYIQKQIKSGKTKPSPLDKFYG